MTIHSNGTFEVQMNVQPADDQVGDPGIARMSIDKQFFGALQGTSKGQMLSVGTGVDGSAGYVAIERFSGTLNGRNGTFALQHTGIMTRGVPQLTITIVPDSGTDQLATIAGVTTIDITDGKHVYDLEYTLDEPA